MLVKNKYFWRIKLETFYVTARAIPAGGKNWPRGNRKIVPNLG